MVLAKFLCQAMDLCYILEKNIHTEKKYNVYDMFSNNFRKRIFCKVFIRSVIISFDISFDFSASYVKLKTRVAKCRQYITNEVKYDIWVFNHNMVK